MIDNNSIYLQKEYKFKLKSLFMQSTVFNPIQIHLLQMFNLDNTETGLTEMKNVLYSYYSKKMKDRFNELWDSGELDQQRLDQINKMDLHKL